MLKLASVVSNSKRKCNKALEKYAKMIEFIDMILNIKFKDIGVNQGLIQYLINACG